MSVIKNKLKSNFTQIPNGIIFDNNLTSSELRVLLFLWSCDDNWEIQNNYIMETFNIKDKSTMSRIWKKLISLGYIERKKSYCHVNNRPMGGYDYILNTELTEMRNNEISVSSHLEQLKVDQNPTLEVDQSTENNNNTYFNNTKKNNTEKTNTQTDDNQYKRPITRKSHNKHLDLKPADVSENIWLEFVKYRKEIKATITERIIKNILSQAEKAKLTLSQAIEIMLDNGWRGFNADWLNKQQQHQQQPIKPTAPINPTGNKTSIEFS